MKIRLRNVRLAFPNIWEPKPFQAGEDPRYNAVFLFADDHTDECNVYTEGPDNPGEKTQGAKTAVQKAIRAVAKEKWDDQYEEVLASVKNNPNKFCFMSGDTKNYDGFANNLYIRAASPVDNPPKIVGLDGKPLRKEQGVIYAGCYTVAILDVWAQDNQWGKGIQCSLLGVQFYREGDAFSAGIRASDNDFQDLSDGADAPDIIADEETEAQAASGGLI